MPNLLKFFEDLNLNRDKWTNSSTGESFENNIVKLLKHNGFDRISKNNDKVLTQYLKEIKEDVINPLKIEVLPNNLIKKGLEYKNFFVFQPYGSQSYPDLLLFTKENIYEIELKHTVSGKGYPMWNGNLPKSNGIYIFGSSKIKDITFFTGESILPHNERIEHLKDYGLIVKFYEEIMEKRKEAFRQGKIKLEVGFDSYPRKTFTQSKNINKNADLDFFKSKKRPKRECEVFELIEKHENKSLKKHDKLKKVS